jgi:catechol 2,3-dioxygenase-like lactoylglutathione lyase family enzyme
MSRSRIRHIAIAVADREKAAEFYKRVFGMEEKERGPRGTIYLSDGHVDLALIKASNSPKGINHFGFQVNSVKAIERTANTEATPSPAGSGRHAEFWILDVEGNKVDVSEEGWPI